MLVLFGAAAGAVFWRRRRKNGDTNEAVAA
ncbi:PEP-CTERM sorting domain-containing protein [Aurantiacibacter zhengii]|nr:PEP-CTERM sorting domain-containing protein [Aurantiacibacter zhengii]